MRRVLAVGEQEELREVICLKLAHNSAGNGVAVFVDGSGSLQAYETDAARHISLPAAEQHAVAVPHQKAVSGIKRIGRHCGLTSIIKTAHYGLPTPVYDIEKDAAVALFHIRGFEQREVRGKPDFAI